MTSTAAVSSHPPIGLGTVVAVADDHVGVRTDALGALRAEVATHPRPRAGDRVVIATAEGGRAFVIGVLRRHDPDDATSAAAMPEPAPGERRWVLPEGDIELCAERGRVVLRGRDGVVVESDADVSVSASGAVSLESAGGRSELRLDRDTAELRAGLLVAKASRLRVLAEELEAVAVRADTQIERARLRFDVLETEAERIVQSAHTLLTRVEDLAHTRAGRIRFSAEGALHAIAGRVRLVAREVFHLDGERIHLG